MDEMSKIYGTILGIAIWFIAFALTLLVASIPKWNEWVTSDIRSFFCYFMAFLLFFISPVCVGAVIYKAWRKHEKH